MVRWIALTALLTCIVWTGGFLRALSMSRWSERRVDKIAEAVLCAIPKSALREPVAPRVHTVENHRLSSPGTPRMVPLTEWERRTNDPSFGESVGLLARTGGSFGTRSANQAVRFQPFGVSVPSLHLGDDVIGALFAHVVCGACASFWLRKRLHAALSRSRVTPRFLYTGEFCILTSPVWLATMALLHPSVDFWAALVQESRGTLGINVEFLENVTRIVVLLLAAVTIVAIGAIVTRRWVRTTKLPCLPTWREFGSLCTSCGHPLPEAKRQRGSNPSRSSLKKSRCSECGKQAATGTPSLRHQLMSFFSHMLAFDRRILSWTLRSLQVRR
jgi:hypothetical protein